MSSPIFTAIIVFERMPTPQDFHEPIMTKEFTCEKDAENWVTNLIKIPFAGGPSDFKYTWQIIFGVAISNGSVFRNGPAYMSSSDHG